MNLPFLAKQLPLSCRIVYCPDPPSALPEIPSSRRQVLAARRSCGEKSCGLGNSRTYMSSYLFIIHPDVELTASEFNPENWWQRKM